MATIYNLTPVGNQKSFYGKARVTIDDNGDKTLYSYSTPVVKIRSGKVTLGDYATCSSTTLKHVKSFLAEQGFAVYSKGDLRKHYDSERF